MKGRLNLLREFSIPLLAGVTIALVWTNPPTGAARVATRSHTNTLPHNYLFMLPSFDLNMR